MAIRWAQDGWKDVSGTTLKNCFEKCGIIKNDDLMEIEEEDLEFEALVQELCPDVSATEYHGFCQGFYFHLKTEIFPCYILPP